MHIEPVAAVTTYQVESPNEFYTFDSNILYIESIPSNLCYIGLHISTYNISYNRS